MDDENKVEGENKEEKSSDAADDGDSEVEQLWTVNIKNALNAAKNLKLPKESKNSIPTRRIIKETHILFRKGAKRAGKERKRVLINYPRDDNAKECFVNPLIRDYRVISNGKD